MTPKRILGCILLLAGISVAIAPSLIPDTDDSTFLSTLRQKDGGGEWTSHGATYVKSGNRRYTFTVDQKVRENAKGHVVEAVRTLVATEDSGQKSTYRLTIEYSENGALLDEVLETPTRTVRKSRGPTGRDPYRETVLIDTAPPYRQPAVLWACYGVGAATILAGVALVILGSRRARPKRHSSDDE